MPRRKRKAASALTSEGDAKKAKSDESEPAVKQIVSSLKASESGKKAHKVDKNVAGRDNYQVVEDYDCMLNQTNIRWNNNKFYVIQLLKTNDAEAFYVYCRWGRVGEKGTGGPGGKHAELSQAVKEFKKRFRSKTGNKWEKRSEFRPISGKYTLLEMDDEEQAEEEQGEEKKEEGKKKGKKNSNDTTSYLPCSLPKPTETLLRKILDSDMFLETMRNFDLDTKKLPLGKISKAQIAKGFECLEEMERIIRDEPEGAARNTKLIERSSRFYTLIPHDFGRQRPPVFYKEDHVQTKYEQLGVLGEIEIAQSMQKKKQKTLSTSGEEKGPQPHPINVSYQLLDCDMQLLDKESREFKEIGSAVNNRQGHDVIEVWKLNRYGEEKRFAVHDAISNRKLLWHGTRPAVLAAILKTGLRIMPHSGGRCGRGIYFASDFKKSMSFGRYSGAKSLLFLNEVVLGEEYTITVGNSTLKAPPNGKNSVVARGSTEPDPKDDKIITLDKKKVILPAGQVTAQKKYATSHFYQSEYLIYKESQARLRYLVLLK